MSPNDWVLGIDLGTTNTAAVAFGPERPGPLSILHGRQSPVLPSVVSLKNPSTPLVGWLAKDMLLTDPLTTLHGWKRFLGRREQSEYVNRHRSRFPYRIHEDPQRRLGAVVHGQVVNFHEVARLVLDQVRRQASAALRAEVRRCVISVPAHFAKAQRDAVLEAGTEAGLEVLRLVNEPTAASIAFAMDQKLDSRALVFDLGGGTFDASVLELVDNIFDVKAADGESFLGGIDFDRAVMDHLVDHVKKTAKFDPTEEPVVAQRLLNAAEAAKCALSNEASTRIHVPMVGHDRRGRTFDLDLEFSRAELEAATAPLVERCIGIVEKTIAQAGLRVDEIDHVVIIGGQSRMPLVRRRIAETMGQEPLTHLNPDTCVAHGAALVARSETDLSGAVLLDVLSVPIGVVFPGGETRFVFERNDSLPARRRVPLPRPQHGQGVSMGLWQGVDVTSSDRQVLGVLHVAPHHFREGTDFAIEMNLDEQLQLNVAFVSSIERIPLVLSPSRQT
ncbi:MAG: Hsp70 family protein [Myxococcota bacterium]